MSLLVATIIVALILVNALYVAAEFAADFPQPEKLWTIADLGGWKDVDSTLFKKDVGSIAKIYDAATE